MGSPGSAFLAIWLALALLGGCTAHRLPPPPPGVSLRPGNFLQEYYFASGFAPDQVSYALEPVAVEQARGVTTETFSALFQAELTRAWEANGLKITDQQPDCRLALTIQQISVTNGRFRFLWGKTSALVLASGVISQNGRILFAFRDRLSLDSPVSPGAPAPQETELLLKRLSQELAHRLLNELLLHDLLADDQASPPNIRTGSRGRF
jgi:hypothetical protein